MKLRDSLNPFLATLLSRVVIDVIDMFITTVYECMIMLCIYIIVLGSGISRERELEGADIIMLLEGLSRLLGNQSRGRERAAKMWWSRLKKEGIMATG